MFQSPSLRGSGLFDRPLRICDIQRLAFQSPSLRGSGLFASATSWRTTRPSRFNPLHCGAVVSSSVYERWVDEAGSRFQSPSLRGSGLFCLRHDRTLLYSYVSIPFIAGQWSLHGGKRRRGKPRKRFQSPSLRGSGLFRRRPTSFRASSSFQSPSLRGSGLFQTRRYFFAPPHGGFNPLHCGAVVSSNDPALAAVRLALGFNPLHCGAVVSSSWRLTGAGARKGVSIPFIAGQWSLPGRGGDADPPPHVSIPFIAGQWSLLRISPPNGGDNRGFQSPSLRGSGLFPPLPLKGGGFAGRLSTVSVPPNARADPSVS